jgi:GH24 family phage-related lysozyme (muramidase)
MDRDALAAQLAVDEGKMLVVYHGKTDRPGVWTVGVGHMVLPQDHLALGQTITEAECQAFLAHDIGLALGTCHKVWVDFDALPEEAQQVLAGMAFNLGETRLRTFRLFIAAVTDRAWQRAAMQLRHSLYYGQVTHRAERYAARLEALARA